MKLYITKTSPYARMARVIVREKGLTGQVEEIVARTREAESPYYQINPSGRVPYLLMPDGTGFEDTPVIAERLDELVGAPQFAPVQPGWGYRRLQATAHSMMDGVSVWMRELRRPKAERSPRIIAHEQARSVRLVAELEKWVDDPLMTGPFNQPQLTVIAALHIELMMPDFDWRPGAPRLAEWVDRLAQRPSLQDTVPPNSR